MKNENPLIGSALEINTEWLIVITHAIIGFICIVLINTICRLRIFHTLVSIQIREGPQEYARGVHELLLSLVPQLLNHLLREATACT